MRQPIDVTTLNLYAKAALEQFEDLQDVMVTGEVTGFVRHHKSGHCYFTLRDTRSSIKAVMFARQASLIGFLPQDGMQVIVYGHATIYERDGAFQLYVDYLKPSGVGSAQQAFDQLKAKLEREGLFDSRYKKPVPEMPRYVGVVTSKTGAALQDIINVMSRRWAGAKLLLAPVNVQGLLAEQEIAQGIRALEADGRADVILVARGGGSREDLWVFNSELIARTAFACKIPIISAVGHEIDYSILDYVADLRAPTPSAAAELCVPDRQEWQEKIQYLAENIQKCVQKKLEVCYNNLNICNVADSLEQHRKAVERKQVLLEETVRQIQEKQQNLAAGKQQQLATSAALAHSLSPYAVLARGYSVVEKNGRIEDVGTLLPGDKITLLGADAKAACTVEQVTKTEVSQ